VPIKKGFQPLSITHPKLAKEADGWDASTKSKGQKDLVSWRCHKGHQWEARINARVTRKSGCPFCSNNKVWAGFNDITTTHPEIALTIVGADPKTLSAGSDKVVSWTCSVGHTYPLQVKKRIGRNYGCPFCSHSKVLIGFNDFETKHPEIAKEADGWDPKTVMGGSAVFRDWKCQKGHKYRAKVSSRDANGTGCPYCANQLVLPGFNDLATTHPELAAQADGWDPTQVISGRSQVDWICSSSHRTKASINTRKRGSGCRVCMHQEVLKGYNDLLSKYPKIAMEASDWDPSTVLPKSGKSREWKCKAGHKWKATIGSRTGLEAGCPYCSNTKVLVGFNDLATTHPEIARQAFGWDPSTITFGSNIKKLWKCSKDHKWKISPTVRTAKGGSGCPTCAETGFDPNADGYLYFLRHPDWEMFQIGITNDPDTRIGKHNRIGWELLELRGPMDGHLTQQWETAILRMLKAKGADLSNSKIAGKFDGYSEAWSKSKFEVKSIKELMRLTEEFEENSLKKKRKSRTLKK
jgi:hypothetical protein